MNLTNYYKNNRLHYNNRPVPKVGELPGTPRRILKLLESGPRTANEIVEELNLTNFPVFQSAVWKLVNRGYLHKEGKGREAVYSLKETEET